MKFKIVNHWNKENGHFLGYSIRYKPFFWCPFWEEIYKSTNGHELYSDMKEVEHDICFILKMRSVIGKKDRFL